MILQATDRGGLSTVTVTLYMICMIKFLFHFKLLYLNLNVVKKSIFLQTMFILDYVRYAYDGCQSREGNVLSENFLRNCCVKVHFKIFYLFNLKLFGRLK